MSSDSLSKARNYWFLLKKRERKYVAPHRYKTRPDGIRIFGGRR